jgi:hypothetical protein
MRSTLRLKLGVQAPRTRLGALSALSLPARYRLLSGSEAIAGNSLKCPFAAWLTAVGVEYLPAGFY